VFKSDLSQLTIVKTNGNMQLSLPLVNKEGWDHVLKNTIDTVNKITGIKIPLGRLKKLLS
jgi:hypothetical protein